jgi:hypothetical protein
MTVSWMAALVTAAFAQEAAISPDVLLLMRAQEKALNAMDKLPDHVCAVTVERFSRKQGARNFTRQGRAAFELAVIGGKEMYARTGTDAFTAEPPETLRGISIPGRSAGHLRTIFNDATMVRLAGTERIAGRRVARYDFRAPAFPRPVRIRAGTTAVETASRGSFWIDWESGDIARIEMQADGIPAGIGVASILDRAAYAQINLGGLEVLLPSHAETEVTDLAGGAWRSVSKFTACRRYQPGP